MLFRSSGIVFPVNAIVGDYFLRLDYLPNRLFRFDGKRWVKVEDAVRDNYTPGSGTNLRSQFIDNTANVVVGTETVQSRQGLSKALANRKKIV